MCEHCHVKISLFVFATWSTQQTRVLKLQIYDVLLLYSMNLQYTVVEDVQ